MDIVQIGSTAPNFLVKDQHGHNISLSDYKGKKSVTILASLGLDTSMH